MARVWEGKRFWTEICGVIFVDQLACSGNGRNRPKLNFPTMTAAPVPARDNDAFSMRTSHFFSALLRLRCVSCRRVRARWPSACHRNSCRFLCLYQSGVYLLRPGGKSFSSFCAPLLSLSWYFSSFLPGSMACWAPPIQTSFFTAGSYIPTTKVPT